MANMTLVKTPMPEQDPQVRARNFKEVALGYTAEQAIEEAGRCLKCKNPKCVEGSPIRNCSEQLVSFLLVQFGAFITDGLVEHFTLLLFLQGFIT